MLILCLILMIAAYFLGSIPSAIIVSKLKNLPDPRDAGSGNPGATNMLRLGGRNAAIMVFVADLLKGFIPVVLGHMFGMHPMGLGFIALAAVLGHIFPAFANFQGGKGVATALGGLLGLSLSLGLLAIIVWVAVVMATRYVSLGSLVASVLSLFLSTYFINIAVFIPLLVMVSLIIWRHMENIQRLQAGTENKVDWKM